MTWAERFGDVAANVALVFINFFRIFTYLLMLASRALDGLVTNLGERTESGLSRTTTTERAVWLRIFSGLFLGVIAVALRLLSIATVFLRQVFETLDEFFRVLAEGEGAPTPGTGP